MSDQITVPKQTFDAMREALEGIMRWQVKNVNVWHNSAYDIAHDALTAANAVRPLADISEVPRTEHEYSIKLGTLQPQAQGEAKTYAPSRQRVVMACDILDRIKEAHENWGGWSGTPSSCDAAINLLRYPANMPVNAAQPQATEPAGYKLVPVEPTPAMLYAIQNDCDILPPRGKRIWAAMLAAAPEAKQ